MIKADDQGAPEMERLFLFLGLQRVDHFEERKAVKIGICTVNKPEPVFAHQYCRVSVVHQPAGELRNLIDETCQLHSVISRGNQNVSTYSKHDLQERPGIRQAHRAFQCDGIRYHPQKLVAHRPR